MDFSSKQNELKEYLKSEENLKICKPFIDESEKLAEIKNEYLPKCRGIYSDFSNHVSKKEYASDSELHRGYYCPDIISDMVIGNCHRGKLYKRLTSKTKPCFEYGFDSENRLTVVNFPGYDDHEIILYDGKSTVGILFSEDCDNGNIEISGAIGEGQNRQLNVENGTFNGTFSVSGNVPANIAISGGTFSSEVEKDYLANGFVVNKNTDGTYGVTAGSGFVGANVVVTESLAMKVVVGTASKYVVVTYKGLDGIDKSVKLDTLTDGYYLFDRIMPQMIDVKFSFELYGENDVMLDRKANYSVVDYLADIITSEKDSAEFRNVAASLIEYANKAMAVKGLTTTVAPTFVDKAGNAVELKYNAFVAKNKIPAKDTLGAISEGSGQVIYKARVVFDDAYTLKFYTNAGDGYTYTLSKNGSTEEEDITFDKNGEFTINVLAQDITTQYVIKVYGEDTTQPIQTVTYGVSTYCIRMQETKTPQGELYVASYYYGVAVQQYGAANAASVK